MTKLSLALIKRLHQKWSEMHSLSKIMNAGITRITITAAIKLHKNFELCIFYVFQVLTQICTETNCRLKLTFDIQQCTCSNTVGFFFFFFLSECIKVSRQNLCCEGQVMALACLLSLRQDLKQPQYSVHYSPSKEHESKDFALEILHYVKHF